MNAAPILPASRKPDLPQAWVVITRPNNLPNALATAHALADRYPGGCHLILENSSWWRRVRWEEYRARFAAVHVFERVRAARGLLDVRRLHRQFAHRQRTLAALPFNPAHDVLVCLAGVTQLANAASAAFRAGRRVLCVPGSVHEGLVRPPDRWRYRSTTANWVQHRLVEPRLGLERTWHLKPRLNHGGDGVRHLRLHRQPEDVYDAVVVLNNSGSFPAREAAAPRTFPARFPTLDELGLLMPDVSVHTSPPRRRVVFFGTPFLLVKNLLPARYAARLDECLDSLRRFYPDHAWVYRPHPAETGEAAALRLDGFEVEQDGEMAELYFLRHAREIAAVFSVSSTVSRVALNFGLPAYCFWRCFPFAETQQRYFEQVMGDVPPGFERRDLSEPPEFATVAWPVGASLRAALHAALGAGPPR